MDFLEKAIKLKKGIFQSRGWVKRKRELKNKIFFVMRDETTELQCVVDRDNVSKETAEAAEKIGIETSLEFKGELKKDDRAPNGVECLIKEIKIIGLTEEFPIQRDFSTEFLLDVRHLWLRSQKMRDALKVRKTVFQGFREAMEKENALEVQAPMFVTGAVEGGSTLFEVPYFDKKAFLTQSSQFYLETMIFSLGKVYTIAPSFRAEKSRTSRHLTEFWHAEAEFPWIQFKELLDLEERMLQYMVQLVLEKNKKELIALGRDPKTLEPSAFDKYPRITYDEILKQAQKKFPKLKHGNDLGEKEERELTRDNKTPVIVTHYPTSLKPFYHRPDPENPKFVLCNDILAPEGYGEIVGSGERTWTEKEIFSRMKDEKINSEPYKWYTDLRKYGAIPHSGFGLGLDRMTAWLIKAENIKEVIPFPRTMTRLYP